jgi:peptidoglycan/LPS O-acetylase OafA/YrhL
VQGWNQALTFGLYWLWALLVIIPCSSLSYLLVEKPGVALGEKLWYQLKKKGPLPAKQAASATDNAEPAKQETMKW